MQLCTQSTIDLAYTNLKQQPDNTLHGKGSYMAYTIPSKGGVPSSTDLEGYTPL